MHVTKGAHVTAPVRSYISPRSQTLFYLDFQSVMVVIWRCGGTVSRCLDAIKVRMMFWIDLLVFSICAWNCKRLWESRCLRTLAGNPDSAKATPSPSYLRELQPSEKVMKSRFDLVGRTVTVEKVLPKLQLHRGQGVHPLLLDQCISLCSVIKNTTRKALGEDLQVSKLYVC